MKLHAFCEGACCDASGDDCEGELEHDEDRLRNRAPHGGGQDYLCFGTIAPEPHFFVAANVLVVFSDAKGQRVAEHEPGDGDEGCKCHGLESRGENTLEAGEATW